MILTVTPNPALDVTYTVPGAFATGKEHRVADVAVRPGGKGLNVARVLHTLGEPVSATGIDGGPGGQQLRAYLVQAGITHDFVDALPDVRRTVVVRDADNVTTSLWEPGYAPDDGAAASEKLVDRIRARLAAADVLAINGSVPPGVSKALPAQLSREAAVAGVPCVVDTSGEALVAAIDAGDAVIMPNREELAAAAGRSLSDPGDAESMARGILHEHKLPAVVVTLGADGMLAVTNSGAWRASLGEDVAGNPTGAGDAACAAVARGLRHGWNRVDWPATLADAVALSAAAVLRPVAGEFDLDAYRHWLPTITVVSL